MSLSAEGYDPAQSKFEGNVASGSALAEETKNTPSLEGPEPLFVTPGFASDPTEEHSLWYETVMFSMTLFSFHVGSSNLLRFPVSALNLGGLYFIAVYFCVLLLIGCPMSFFECIVGQLSQKGISNAYGTYGRAFKGVSYSFTFVAFCMIFQENMSISYLVSSFSSGETAIFCGNTWNTPECVSVFGTLNCGTNNTSPYCLSSDINNNKSVHTDAMLEFNRSVRNGLTAFSFEEFLVLLTMSLSILGVGYFGPFWLFVFYSFAAVLTFMFLIAMVFSTSEHFLFGLKLIWERTIYQKILTLEAMIEVCMSVMYSISLGAVGITSVASFRKPKDGCFIPSVVACVIDFVGGMLGLLIMCGLMGEAMHRASPGYLLDMINGANYGNGFMSAIFLTGENGLHWDRFSLAVRIFLIIPGATSFIWFVVAFTRDSCTTIRQKQIWFGIVAGFITIICLLIASRFGKKLHNLLFTLNVFEMNLRIMFFLALTIVVFVYGANELYIDLCEIYEESEGWRKLISPSGTIVFTAWTKVCPVFLVMTAAILITTEVASINHVPWWPWLSMFILPSIGLGLVVGTAIVEVVRQWRNEQSLWDLIYPTEEHMAYYRIMRSTAIFAVATPSKDPAIMTTSNDK